jgi:hypothetical protein
MSAFNFSRIFFTPTQISLVSSESLCCLLPDSNGRNIEKVIIDDPPRSIKINLSEEKIRQAEAYFNSTDQKEEILNSVPKEIENKAAASFSMVVALNYIVADELKLPPFSDELTGKLSISESVWKRMFFSFWKLWFPVFTDEEMQESSPSKPERETGMSEQGTGISQQGKGISQQGKDISQQGISILSEGGDKPDNGLTKVKESAIQEIYLNSKKIIKEIEEKSKKNSEIFDEYANMKKTMTRLKQRLDKLEHQLLIMTDILEKLSTGD